MTAELLHPLHEVGWFPCRRCGVPIDAAGTFADEGIPIERHAGGRRAHILRRCDQYAGAVRRRVWTSSCPLCPGVEVEAVRCRREADREAIEPFLDATRVALDFSRWHLGHFVPGPAGRPMAVDAILGRWHHWEATGHAVDLMCTLTPGAGWVGEVQ